MKRENQRDFHFKANVLAQKDNVVKLGPLTQVRPKVGLGFLALDP